MNLAHKQVLYNRGMLSHHAGELNKPQRILPVVRVNDVCDCQRRPREHPGGRQDALALPPARLPQVQPAHTEYHRQQHKPERPQVYRQAHPYAAQQERANSVLAKGAMREIERDYQHRRERDVFAIKERVRVQARMQQKHQHSE